MPTTSEAIGSPTANRFAQEAHVPAYRAAIVGSSPTAAKSSSPPPVGVRFILAIAFSLAWRRPVPSTVSAMANVDLPGSPWLRAIRLLAIGTSIVVGLGLILIAATLGRCDAFGGRCPADRPSLLGDDVFGMAAFGTALAVMIPGFLHRPSRRRLGVTVVVGLMAALVIGLLVRATAYG